MIKPKANMGLDVPKDEEASRDRNSGNITPRSNVSQKISHHVEMLRIMEVENNSLKDQLTNLEMEHKRKLTEMATMLGLDCDLEKMLEDRNSGKACPELATFEKQKTAIVTSENLKLRVGTIEKKIAEQKKILVGMNEEKKQQTEKHEMVCIIWKEKIDKKVKEINDLEVKNKKELKDMNENHYDEVSKTLEKEVNRQNKDANLVFKVDEYVSKGIKHNNNAKDELIRTQ